MKPPSEWLRKHSSFLSMSLLLISTTLVYAFRFNRNWLPNDDCFYLDVVVRLFNGEVPYRDIALMHGLGFFLYLMPFLKLFGISLFSGKIALALISFATVLCTFQLARNILPAFPAFVCALIMIPLGPISFYTLSASWLAALMVILALYALIKWEQKEYPNSRFGSLFWSGLWMGLAFSTKQPFGLYTGMATTLWLMLIFATPTLPSQIATNKRNSALPVSILAALGIVGVMAYSFLPVASKSNFLIFFALPLLFAICILQQTLHSSAFRQSQFSRAFGTIVLGGLCGLIPTTLYQLIVAGWPGVVQMYQGMTVGAGHYAMTFYMPMSIPLGMGGWQPPLLIFVSLILCWFFPRIGIWLLVISCLWGSLQFNHPFFLTRFIYQFRIMGLWFIVGTAWFMWLQNKSDTHNRSSYLYLMLMSLTSSFLFLSVYSYAGPVNLVYPVLPFVLSMALIWHMISKRLNQLAILPFRLQQSLSTLMLIGILSGHMWAFIQHTGLLHQRAGLYLSHPRGHIYIDSTTKDLIMPAVQFIEQHRTRKIMVIPDGPQIYFLSGHPNALPYYHFPQPLFPAAEQQYLTLLNRPDMDYVLWTDYHLNYRVLQYPASIVNILQQHYTYQGQYGAYHIFKHRQ